ncbi:MAG TPA: glycosyltransferase family 2 protein [Thermoanaerobaculia bacterium]|nr:glycosyltransferase family 2 protein [Thermoanaerobaculia bacterium]
MTQPRVSVLIPTTSQAARLSACLTALAADRSAVPREIVLVLNAASPEVREVAGAAQSARIVESEVNLGVPGGYNRARAAARGELLALLHDDTEVAPGWLDRLAGTLDARPEAGIVGGLVLDADGRLQNAGSILWRDGWARWQWWGETPPAPESFAEIDVVHTVGSSFSLLRAEVFDRAGGLDESLHPGYFVDVTLGMCVRAQGRVVLLDPGARAVHHRGSSSSTAYRMFVSHRNHARFCARWAAQLTAEHEPFVYTPEAYAAAHERARAGAARLAAARRWESAPPPPPFMLDAAAQERRLLAAEAAVRREWAEELERRLAATESGAAPTA